MSSATGVVGSHALGTRVLALFFLSLEVVCGSRIDEGILRAHVGEGHMRDETEEPRASRVTARWRLQ